MMEKQNKSELTELIQLYNRLKSQKEKDRLIEWMALVEIAREMGIKIPIDEVGI